MSQIEYQSRRVRASVSVSVSLAVMDENRRDERGVRRVAPVSGWTPVGLQDPTVRWDELPPRIPPEQWSCGQSDAALPGTILFAEAERRAEGFGTPG